MKVRQLSYNNNLKGKKTQSNALQNVHNSKHKETFFKIYQERPQSQFLSQQYLNELKRVCNRTLHYTVTK